MDETTAAAGTTDRGDNPDHFLVGKVAGRLPDGGPRYKETPADPYAPGAAAVAEPFNAVTAAFFIVIVVVWGRKVLRAGVEKHLFVAACLPILLVGGIGGTLYHAFRTRMLYFLLDVFPISMLGLAGAVYLLIRVGSTAGWRRLAGYGLAAVAFYLFLNGVIFRGLLGHLTRANPALNINLSYASLALIVVIPLGFVLARTRFRHGGLVVAALVSFGIAWFCRLVDGAMMTDLPMGTHWLWHTFGAITTGLLIEYFFRLETEEV